MNKAIVIAFVLGVGIAIAHGIIELGTFDVVAWSEPSDACLLPPAIAGLVAGIVVMKGIKSRLKGLILVLVAVFIGAVIGHYIGLQILLGNIESELGYAGAAATDYVKSHMGEIHSAILADSGANIIIAFIPAAIGVVVGKKAFRST